MQKKTISYRCVDAVKTSTNLQIIIAIIAVLTILAVGVCVGGAGMAYALGHRSFLDVMDATIAGQCQLRPFYAGTASTPPARLIVPALGALEDNWDLVRDEMAETLAGGRAPGAPRRKTQGIVSLLIHGGAADRPSPGAYSLVEAGRVVSNECEATTALLMQIPNIQSARFLVAPPNTYGPPRSAPAKGMIRYHLALRAPKARAGCFIEVAGEKYSWAEGESILFDEAFDHRARNDTEEERVVLAIGLLRPLTGLAAALQGVAYRRLNADQQRAP